MKKKLFMGALAAALVCGLALSACESEVLDVKVVNDKANAVAAVTAALTTDKAWIIVSWDAVEDAGGYQLLYKLDGAKTVSSGDRGQNEATYAPADGNAELNTNPDKWSVRIRLNSGYPNLIPGKTYVFGVRTSPFTQDNITYSDIVWSVGVKIPE